MSPLKPAYQTILWVNVIGLSVLIGFMFYKKFARLEIGVLAGLVFGVIEYFVMRFSLGKKQEREEQNDR